MSFINNLLAKELGQITGLGQEAAAKFLDAFLSLLVENLLKTDSFTLKGLGTFQIVKVEATQAVNPMTGKKYEIAAHPKAIFRGSKALKKALKERVKDRKVPAAKKNGEGENMPK
ncbi:MAG: HU family DNA-binding protein [Deltaproteobacteria bacterium]|jgi:nucleoid DNA-binding protein|nr:HU family DNA-binding protein [Deltaproteobacteria bacterium]